MFDLCRDCRFSVQRVSGQNASLSPVCFGAHETIRICRSGRKLTSKTLAGQHLSDHNFVSRFPVATLWLRRLSRSQNNSDSTKHWFVHQKESIALYNGCFSKNGFALFVTFMNRRCKKGMEYNTVQQKWIWHELPFHNQNQLFLQCWEHDNNYTDIEKFALLQLSLLFLICEWICSMNEYAKLSLADKFLWWQIDGE